MDRFGFSLGFCHLEFDKKAISDCFMALSRVFLGLRGGGGRWLILEIKAFVVLVDLDYLNRRKM